MKIPKIYALVGASEDERYVGVTTLTLKARLQRHVGEARGGATHHRACWIRSCLSQGVIPRIVWIDDVQNPEEWGAVEAAYIIFYRDCGCDLTNATPGGEGLGAGENSPNFGKKRNFSPQHRENLSRSRKGIRYTTATLEKMRLAKLGKKRGPHSPAHCAKLRAALQNRGPWTDAQRKKTAETWARKAALKSEGP